MTFFIGVGPKTCAVYEAPLTSCAGGQWASHTMAFCERQQKQFAIRKPLFERTFCTPCTLSLPSRTVSRHICLNCQTASRSDDLFDFDRRPCSDSRHVTAPYRSALYDYYYN